MQGDTEDAAIHGMTTMIIIPIRIDKVNSDTEDQEWLQGEVVLIMDLEDEDMMIVIVKTKGRAMEL